MTKRSSTPFLINAGIIFSAGLLILLLAALAGRVIYPRIVPERTDLESHLISNVIQVEVLNGCGVAGVATRFTNHLRSLGFDVVSSGNFESFDLEHSIIIDRTGNRSNAARVARALGIDESRIIRETSPFFYLDATVVIGADHADLNL
ncbi:MAG: LytR C-terminal domain-containing protein [Balneolales bacterium]|nr:LytR C-terminal domain-containing protein [Balneolales bacterium]